MFIIVLSLVAVSAGGALPRGIGDTAQAAPTDPVPMPTPRKWPGVAVVDGLVYVLGGRHPTNSGVSYLVEEYDPAQNTWRSRGQHHFSVRTSNTATAPDGKVYIAGDAGYLNTLSVYDPQANTWAALPHLNWGTIWPGAAVLNGKVYVAGGWLHWNNLHVYDIAGQTWTPGADMVGKRGFFPLIAANGRLYAFGGNDGSTAVSGVEEYDSATNSWRARASMPYIAENHAAVLGSNGRIYVGAGPGLLEYDPVADHWRDLPALPRPRTGYGMGALADGRIVVVGGTSAGPPYVTGRIDIFDLATETWQSAPVTPPTVTSFVLEDGATYIRSTNPSTSLSHAGPDSPVSDMSFSTDGQTWSPWFPVLPRASWSVPAGDGVKTVHVKVRDAAGNISAPVSDTIVLDVHAPTGIVGIVGSTPPTGSPPTRYELSLGASDAGSGVTGMRLSSRPDFAGANWQPYVTRQIWDFAGGRTVYVQFMDGSGQGSQTYSTTAPASTVGPSAVACSPRPRVVVERSAAGGALNVTVRVTGDGNAMQSISFGQFANAIVDAPSKPNQTSPFTVAMPTGQEPTSFAFTLRRLGAQQTTTVQLTVLDACGSWSTFVGGGPNAF